MTKRRQLILDYVKQHSDLHLTAEDVYIALKSDDAKIGVATVYRNLKILVDQGILKEISLEKQGVRYDYAEVEHYHFICDTCGAIENFQLDALKNLTSDVEQLTQGIVTSKDLLFHGTCKHCLDQ